MEARTAATPHGAIRFDASLPIVPDGGWFDPVSWRRRGARVTVLGAGRGSAWSIRSAADNYVLRHYHRGGAVRRMLGDRYWYRGAEQTRSFVEFDLLARLSDEGFQVPRPVAVMYERDGPWYRADLLMHSIEGRSLNEVLRAREAVDWHAVGCAISRLHRRGVWHADLNAHNALIDDARRVWLIDFDRARIRRRSGSWQRANLERLRRSLRKLGHDAELRAAWPVLQRGYGQATT